MKNLAARLAAFAAIALPALAAAQQSAPAGGEVMFVSGAAQRHQAGGSQVVVTKGMKLLEGDRIRTSDNSHVYVRLRDGGLLVVRPGSELVVERWRYDPAQPEDTEIKYLLENGVARHVSGKGAKAARDKFRFNTPLAAIGVRGTDFTVLADPAVTRVAVRSGGVVMASLGNGCRAEGTGPCEGDSAMELFAGAKERLLQVRVGERKPELVEKPAGPAPDAVRPPALVEPVSKTPAGDPEVLAEIRTSEVVTQVANKAAADQANKVAAEQASKAAAEYADAITAFEAQQSRPVEFAAWGRWAPIAQDASAPTAEQVLASGRLSTLSAYDYLLSTTRPSGALELPGSGTASFRMVGHDGVIRDKETGKAVTSTASDGRFSIDFGQRTFDTSLSVTGGGQSTTIGATGTIDSDGHFRTRPFHAPTGEVQGVVGQGGNEAAYLYQREIGTRYEAAGAAAWRKQEAPPPAPAALAAPIPAAEIRSLAR